MDDSNKYSAKKLNFDCLSKLITIKDITKLVLLIVYLFNIYKS